MLPMLGNQIRHGDDGGQQYTLMQLHAVGVGPTDPPRRRSAPQQEPPRHFQRRSGRHFAAPQRRTYPENTSFKLNTLNYF